MHPTITSRFPSQNKKGMPLDIAVLDALPQVSFLHSED